MIKFVPTSSANPSLFSHPTKARTILKQIALRHYPTQDPMLFSCTPGENHLLI